MIRGVLPAVLQLGTLWCLGYPDQARKRQEALTLAQELAHPFSLACALSSLPVVYQFRRERCTGRTSLAEAAISLSTRARIAVC